MLKEIQTIGEYKVEGKTLFEMFPDEFNTIISCCNEHKKKYPYGDTKFQKYLSEYEDVINSMDDKELKHCFNDMVDSGCFEWYHNIANIAKIKNIKRVYDIGANLGIQGYFFKELGIQYIPVEIRSVDNVKGALDGVITGEFPMAIKSYADDMVVSRLCIGYLVKFEHAIRALRKFDHMAFDLEIPEKIQKDGYIESIHYNANTGYTYFYDTDELRLRR